ncbi:MAG: endonuclease [Nitrospirae bacterium RBG_13_39_12]|nr:MAG: endonuclease [Nitrospirae bacterium RBG_13_39_12]
MNNLLEIYHKLYHAFGPQHWWPGDSPFEIAVGAILTQNTNWANVEKAIGNLKTKTVLNSASIYKMKTGRLASLIRPAGYFNIKARRLKSFINFLMSEYHGSMKRMRNEEMHTLRTKLLNVHGIGPETADSILLYALDKPFFVTDAYTKRVLSRHNIIKHDAGYNHIQNLFQSTLEKDAVLFNEYHALFVKLGKTYCRKKPLCRGCPLEEI